MEKSNATKYDLDGFKKFIHKLIYITDRPDFLTDFSIYSALRKAYLRGWLPDDYVKAICKKTVRVKRGYNALRDEMSAYGPGIAPTSDMCCRDVFAFVCSSIHFLDEKETV